MTVPNPEEPTETDGDQQEGRAMTRWMRKVRALVVGVGRAPVGVMPAGLALSSGQFEAIVDAGAGRLRRVVSRIGLLLALSVTLLHANAAVAHPVAPRFRVTSTLDGKTVLSHRVHWIARPTLPAVSEVDFLIDGKLRWVEHNPPYTYSGLDGDGYLVTSWLTPTRHRFTIHVKAFDGRTASDTVVARVLAAPAPPAALAGTWQRTIDPTAAPKPGSTGNPTETILPPGTYRLTFDRRWIKDTFPGSWVLPQSNQTGEGIVGESDWNPGATRFHVQGAVMFHPFSDNLPEGSWCYMWGPPADYNWSVTGDTLTLTPVGGIDPCQIRGFVWAGTWMRAR
jgi:hypothetical protein